MDQQTSLEANFNPAEVEKLETIKAALKSKDEKNPVRKYAAEFLEIQGDPSLLSDTELNTLIIEKEALEGVRRVLLYNAQRLQEGETLKGD